MKKESTKGIAWGGVCALLMKASIVLATPTQDEIVKSFNDNMNQAPDYGLLIPWFFAACGAVAVVIYFRNRQKRQAIPQSLNHPKKLVKEIVKSVELDPAEMKRVTQLARELNCDNPLTLLICPSLMSSDAGEKTDAQ
jgi:hypothetical protein